MKKPTLIVTEADYARLSRLIALAGISPRQRDEIQALEEELGRAEIVAPEEVPANVITMNSRAELIDTDTGERMEFTVVFPVYANTDEGKISVLAPIGMGMLGFRAGDLFGWPSPGGV